MVTARFYVAEMTTYAYNPDNVRVVLRAATKGEQNRSWAAATPSGQIEMVVNNPGASEWFKARLAAGEDIAVTFDVAPELDPAA